MTNVINLPCPPRAIPTEPDWDLLDQMLEQASDWIASDAGVEHYSGPGKATEQIIELCRHMLNPAEPIPSTDEPEGLLWNFAGCVNEAATWLLNYYEPDDETRNWIVCLAAGTREPARRFGGWSSWSPEEISYLLHELSDGHWDDCGEKVPGFAIATGGLNIAIAANESDLDDAGMRKIVNGMWTAADFVVGWLGREDVDPRIVASLEAVSEACEWTGEPGPDAVGITRISPFVT